MNAIPRFVPPLLAASFLAFLTANVLHNQGGIDVAVLPSAALGLAAWKWRRVFLIRLSACFIAIPSFAFLNVEVLWSPGDPLYFANHLALALAGVQSVGVLAGSFLPGPAQTEEMPL